MPLTSSKSASDSLASTGASRWFQFDGNAGDFIVLATQTAQVANQYDPTIIDTVITLYGPDQQPIAMNDDALNSVTPDSELWSKLAQSGTYYVQVSECWTWAAANPGTPINCGGTPTKSNTQFGLFFDSLQINPLPGVAFDTEPNNSTNTANLLSYAKASAGGYYMEMLLGDLMTTADKDVYAFAIPNDVPVSQGRLTAGFSLLPGGQSGDGSPLMEVTASVVNVQTGAVLAMVDIGNNDLRVPVQALSTGAKYALVLQHNSSGFTAQDWYVVEHSLGGSNPLETNESGNNSFAGAEFLQASSSNAQAVDFFFGGDIISGGADVDYFYVNVPSGMTKISVSCGSKYMGSGVLDFAVQLFNSANTDLSGGPQMETSSSIILKNLAIPVSANKIIVKLSASGQSASVTGTFYECGVHLTAVAAP